MLAPLVALLIALPTPAPCGADPAVPSTRTLPRDSSYAALFAAGQPYDTFLAQTRARREQWVALTESAVVPAEAIRTVTGISTQLRVLIVAIDGCSDSVNALPYIARLLSYAPSVQLRVVLPTPGAAVMEAYRTPDGRAATPTLIVLDPQDRVVGCWVERPSALQALAIAARAEGTLDRYQNTKQAWYDNDRGVAISTEVAAVIRGAAIGSPLCTATAAR
jgi:hypothetical protein